MSASVSSASTQDQPDFLAQLRGATATPGPAATILEDPGLLRALTRAPRRSGSSTSPRSPGAPEPPLLSCVLAAESRQSSELRALLRAAADRLEYEMWRADAAAQRADHAEAARRRGDDRFAALMRVQRETELAAVRATEEAKRSRMMFEGAQEELRRAQEDIEALEEEKARADTAARQARDVVRQYERELGERDARERGRQEGAKQMAHRFVEGVEAGRREGYDFAKKHERAKRKKIYTEAFEAGRTEGYDEGNVVGRAHERRKALDAFDQFLEQENYSEDASSHAPEGK